VKVKVKVQMESVTSVSADVTAGVFCAAHTAALHGWLPIRDN
jgi:hypothetical protein